MYRMKRGDYMNHLLQVRVTGILIEKENLLIVKQKVSDRNWSLPGGRVEGGRNVRRSYDLRNERRDGIGN